MVNGDVVARHWSKPQNTARKGKWTLKRLAGDDVVYSSKCKECGCYMFLLQKWSLCEVVCLLMS